MTNTLSLLTTKNQSHRKTLNKLDESSEFIKAEVMPSTLTVPVTFDNITLPMYMLDPLDVT